MAKRIRFSLEMDNDIQVRTLEELRDNFSLERVMEYYMNGKLNVWLKDRYLDDIVAQIDELDKNQEDFTQKLCDALGVEYQSFDMDLDEFENRNKRLAKAKEYTDDENILKNIDNIAFDQDELYDRIDEGKNVIYLCGERFEIPLAKKNIHYIGINNPIAVIPSQEEVDFDELGIQFEGIEYDERYASIVIPEIEKAIELYNDEQYEKAFAIFAKHAGRGDADAMTYLGICYEEGTGIDADDQKAFEWYLRGAEAGDSDAMTWVGEFYAKGKGTEKDKKKAFEWYLRGAEAGSPDAMNNVGLCYRYGNGTEKDEEKAFEWFQKGAELDHMYAMRNLASCYQNRVGIDRKMGGNESREKAWYWYKKSAELGNSYAMGQTASYYYEAGKIDEAIGWAQKGAENGDERSIELLVRYHYKIGEYEKIFSMLEPLAQNGDKRAMLTLGELYYSSTVSLHPYHDIKKSNYWLTKAAEAGHHNAAVELINRYNNNGNLQEVRRWQEKLRGLNDLWYSYT